MHRLIRRLLGLGPTTAELHRDALMSAGRTITAGLAEGLSRTDPPDPEKLAAALAYSEAVARRSFPALYDDED